MRRFIALGSCLGLALYACSSTGIVAGRGLEKPDAAEEDSGDTVSSSVDDGGAGGEADLDAGVCAVARATPGQRSTPFPKDACGIPCGEACAIANESVEDYTCMPFEGDASSGLVQCVPTG